MDLKGAGLIPELDIYDPRNPNPPPYSKEYIARYRAAQLARMRRITAWAKATLAELKARNTGEVERPFIVHRTLADPRFLDPTLVAGGATARHPPAQYRLSDSTSNVRRSVFTERS